MDAVLNDRSLAGVARFDSPLGHEPAWKRWLFAVLALLVVGGVAYVNYCFWVPAHAGVDQNGYLVGGRMFARHLSTRIDPVDPVTGKSDPFAFVGLMWVGADLGTATERYYPKYPAGQSVLVAAALKTGELLDPWWTSARYPFWGVYLTYWINPVCSAVAVWVMFLMGRFLAGSALGLIGAVMLSMSPVTLELANNPNSHASTLCFVTAGMYLLLRWWDGGGAWRASAAGLLLGAATTIRYTEGTLLLPLAMAVAFRLAHGRLANRAAGRRFGAMVESALALAWWAIPVSALIIYNLASVGSWTGYDPTNESTGFDWEYFQENWEPMLRQINSVGMFFVFPLSVAGLAWMFFARWQLALLMTGWIVPNLAIYVSYYWAPDAPGNFGMMRIGYLRFFLTVFPGMVALSVWLLGRVGQSMAVGAAFSRRARSASVVAAGCVCAVAMLENWRLTQPNLEQNQRQQLLLEFTTHEILARAPRGSYIFVDRSGRESVLNHLQFAGNDYRLYSGDAFSREFFDRLDRFGRNPDPDQPQIMDPKRAASMRDRLKNWSNADLLTRQRQTILDALDAGRKVFFLTPRGQGDPLPRGRGDSRLRLMPSPVQRVLPDPEGEEPLSAEVVTFWGYSLPLPPREQSRVRGRFGGPQRFGGPRFEGPGQTTWQLIEILPPLTSTGPVADRPE